MVGYTWSNDSLLLEVVLDCLDEIDRLVPYLLGLISLQWLCRPAIRIPAEVRTPCESPLRVLSERSLS